MAARARLVSTDNVLSPRPTAFLMDLPMDVCLEACLILALCMQANPTTLLDIQLSHSNGRLSAVSYQPSLEG